MDVLHKWKTTTSTGLDGIPNVFLKSCAYSLASPLGHIFDFSFNDGRLPNSWKSAVVTPVHKKGPTWNPNNFRPVSLTATCCKVMERVVDKTLLSYYLIRASLQNISMALLSVYKSVTSNLLECLEDWTLNLV